MVISAEKKIKQGNRLESARRGKGNLGGVVREGLSEEEMFLMRLESGGGESYKNPR